MNKKLTQWQTNNMSKFFSFLEKIKLWIKSHKLLSISIASTFVIIISLSIILPLTLKKNINYKSSLEQNYEEKNKTKLLSPFVNMTLWTDTSSEYSNNGVINLAKVMNDTGFKTLHLGFINPDQNKYLNEDGSVRWCWGGYYTLSEQGNDNFQYEGIKKSINDFKRQGGEIIVSFGGQAGVSPWTCTQDVEMLKNMYLDVINLYELQRIDLDIETDNQNATHAKANAKAIKQVQDQTNVKVSLTIPIMPYGWEQKQIDLITAYLDEGVDLICINSMTMCYGGGTLDGEDYAWASIRAIKNAKDQLAVILKNRDIHKTESELYKMLGATVAIGYEGSSYPTFTTHNMKVVANFAEQINLGLLSFWSINRDAQLYYNQGINGFYQFSEICKAFYNE